MGTEKFWSFKFYKMFYFFFPPTGEKENHDVEKFSFGKFTTWKRRVCLINRMVYLTSHFRRRIKLEFLKPFIDIIFKLIFKSIKEPEIKVNI
jgi:hypothetical protein